MQLHCQFDARYQKNLTNACVIVFAGLNQVSASLNRFKPRVAETGFCRQEPNPAACRLAAVSSGSPVLRRVRSHTVRYMCAHAVQWRPSTNCQLQTSRPHLEPTVRELCRFRFARFYNKITKTRTAYYCGAPLLPAAVTATPERWQSLLLGLLTMRHCSHSVAPEAAINHHSIMSVTFSVSVSHSPALEAERCGYIINISAIESWDTILLPLLAASADAARTCLLICIPHPISIHCLGAGTTGAARGLHMLNRECKSSSCLPSNVSSWIDMHGHIMTLNAISASVLLASRCTDMQPRHRCYQYLITDVSVGHSLISNAVWYRVTFCYLPCCCCCCCWGTLFKNHKALLFQIGSGWNLA